VFAVRWTGFYAQSQRVQISLPSISQYTEVSSSYIMIVEEHCDSVLLTLEVGALTARLLSIVFR
jgi:hypothetical protein